MCGPSQTSCRPFDPLFGGATIDRSDQPQSAAYRLRADADQDSQGKGKQGPVRSAFAKALGSASRILESEQANRFPLSWQDSQCATPRSHDSDLLQDGDCQGSYQQARHTAHAATQLCDGALRSGRGLDGYQQALGSQQLYNDHDLSSLPQAALGFHSEPTRLAAGQAMSNVDRSFAGEAQTEERRSGLTVLAVVKQYTQPFMLEHGSTIAAQVKSTLARLGFCRTASMGGRLLRCSVCDYQCNIYNSCTDRHCPQCVGAKRADWLSKTEKLLRSEVTYFQVVFTLPQQLSALALGNRSVLYKLLFGAAWKALSRSIRDELGMQPAAAKVLHTWNQRLEHHPHVHALVPGSGPSMDGKSWIPCRMTKGTLHEPPKPFLVDNKRLGWQFRDTFIAGVERLQKAGKLKVLDLLELKKTLAILKLSDWVVFIEGPPTPNSKAEHVLKYLARYITGGPIANSRLIANEAGEVSFWARSMDKSKKGDRAKVSYSGVEFVRRWSLHILSKGFTRSRFYGGWSNTRRKDYIRTCDELSPEPTRTVDQTTNRPAIDEDRPSTAQKCPKCESELCIETTTNRPSWRELFYGEHQPTWWRNDGSG
jgi:Putative transposase/Transposase zinc-binding domain